MRWQEVETSKVEATDYGGLAMDFEVEGSSVKAVVITAPDGSVVKLQYTGYSLGVFIPGQPPTKRVFRLSGDLLGLHIEEDFEYDSLAESRKTELESSLAGESTLTIEEMKVPIEPAKATA